MGDREVRIDSYFSLPTDLAATMRSWSEFQSGSDYQVHLSSGAETVDVGMARDDEEQVKYVFVRSVGEGPLFHRVLGTVVHALLAHSDDVRVTKWTGHDT